MLDANRGWLELQGKHPNQPTALTIHVWRRVPSDPRLAGDSEVRTRDERTFYTRPWRQRVHAVSVHTAAGTARGGVRGTRLLP